MIEMGQLRIHLIAESYTWVDGGGAFGLVPRALWGRYITPDADNLVPMVQHSLLVQTNGQNVLIDTGYGDEIGEKQRALMHHTQPRGRLIDSLARLGLAPADIDIVINTHLHGDHCGGNLYMENGERVPRYPEALYFTQQREYEDAMRPNERTRASYRPENYQPLVESGQMCLLNSAPDVPVMIAPGIFGVVTPGHTPAHMSILFQDGDQRALFTCDMATYAIHFERLGWMAAYDVEPLIALETKRRWQAWASEMNADGALPLLIFPHDTGRAAGYWRDGQIDPVAVELL